MNEIKLFVAVKACIVNDQNQVLLVRESSAYTDGTNVSKFDLPGGRIECGEKVERTLEREFEEEVGAPSLISSSFLGYNEYFCIFTNDVGEVKNFHHVGLYFSVTCDTSIIKTDPDGHDSLGALFVPIKELGIHNCSQIALEMIQKNKSETFKDPLFEELKTW